MKNFKFLFVRVNLQFNEALNMYAIEFDTVSKDDVIVIPQQYQEELKNKENIRLVVMYDLPQDKKIYKTAEPIKSW